LRREPLSPPVSQTSEPSTTVVLQLRRRKRRVTPTRSATRRRPGASGRSGARVVLGRRLATTRSSAPLLDLPRGRRPVHRRGRVGCSCGRGAAAQHAGAGAERARPAGGAWPCAPRRSAKRRGPYQNNWPRRTVNSRRPRTRSPASAR
jgi:hypothetical protein